MSRGIGSAQRRVLSVLFAFEGWAVESSELKRLVGGDRSNARRTIRTLLERGLIHQWTQGGLRYHELDFVGLIMALPLDLDDPARMAAEELRCCQLSEWPHECNQTRTSAMKS